MQQLDCAQMLSVGNVPCSPSIDDRSRVPADAIPADATFPCTFFPGHMESLPQTLQSQLSVGVICFLPIRAHHHVTTSCHIQTKAWAFLPLTPSAS